MHACTRIGNPAPDKICIDSHPPFLSGDWFVPQSAGESIGVDLLSAKRVRLLVSLPAAEFVADSALH